MMTDQQQQPTKFVLISPALADAICRAVDWVDQSAEAGIHIKGADPVDIFNDLSAAIGVKCDGFGQLSAALRPFLGIPSTQTESGLGSSIFADRSATFCDSGYVELRKDLASKSPKDFTDLYQQKPTPTEQGPVKIMDERGVYPHALDQIIAEQRAYYAPARALPRCPHGEPLSRVCPECRKEHSEATA